MSLFSYYDQFEERLVRYRGVVFSLNFFLIQTKLFSVCHFKVPRDLKLILPRPMYLFKFLLLKASIYEQ